MKKNIINVDNSHHNMATSFTLQCTIALGLRFSPDSPKPDSPKT